MLNKQYTILQMDRQLLQTITGSQLQSDPAEDRLHKGSMTIQGNIQQLTAENN